MIRQKLLDCCFELTVRRQSSFRLSPPEVASEVDLEAVSVVASRLYRRVGAVAVLELATVGTPVGVPPLVPATTTNTVTSLNIRDLHHFTVAGSFLLSSRRAYIYLFRSGVKKVLTKNAGIRICIQQKYPVINHDDAT